MPCSAVWSKRETYQALSSVFLDDVYTPYLPFQIFHHPGKKGQRVIHRPISRWSSRRVHLWSDIDSSQLSCFSTPSCLSIIWRMILPIPNQTKDKKPPPIQSINLLFYLLVDLAALNLKKPSFFSGKKNTPTGNATSHPSHPSKHHTFPPTKGKAQCGWYGWYEVLWDPKHRAPHLPECNREKIAFGWIRVLVNKRLLRFAAAGSLGIYPVCFIDVQNCSEMHLLSFLGSFKAIISDCKIKNWWGRQRFWWIVWQ